MVCRERFSQIGRALTGKKPTTARLSPPCGADRRSRPDKRLSDAGATPEHYSAWAQAAQEDICLRTNPRTATREQIIELYAAAH
jgi:alcohol dehydrogenase